MYPLKKLLKPIFTGLSAILAIAMIALAFFARVLGIDHNDEWGRSRYALLGLGIIILLVVFIWNQPGPVRHSLGFLKTVFLQAKNLATGSPAFRYWFSSPSGVFPRLRMWFISLSAIQFILTWWRKFPIRVYLAASVVRQGYTASFLAGVVVTVVYVWMVSVGHWFPWPFTSIYNDMQAEAFLHGQLHLLEEPDPRLVALADPYDFEARKDIPQLWDATLYQGKYYLYWGPAPSLVVFGIKLVYPMEIADQYLVFGFTLGTFLGVSAVLLRIWRRFFHHLSWQALFITILAAGLVNPMTWLLSRPAVYESAIAGGQFFLIWGIYFALISQLSAKPGWGYLFFAGLFWAAAVASRTTLAIVVIFLSCSLAWRVFRNTLNFPRIGTRLFQTVVFAMPLAAGAVGLMGFNYARFGSPLEFGHRFQLNMMNINELVDKTISLTYVIPNLYAYLLRPITWLPSFPYVLANWFKESDWPFFLNPPPYYTYHEPLTGLVVTMPFTWFALVEVWGYFKSTSLNLFNFFHPRSELTLLGISAWLMGAVVFEFSPLMLFYGSSMRYHADYIPTLMVVVGIGFWGLINLLLHRPAWQRFILWAGFFLSLATGCLGVLLAFTGYTNRFESMNPALYYQLMR